MLQEQQAAGRLLRQQQGGRDVVFNQFAVGQIEDQLVRTEPRGSPQEHCEEQLIRMIRQPQDIFIIYTENFTCQMRVGTERRCNYFFQVLDLALRYPQSLVVIMYHQPYDIQGPSNRGTGRQERWEQIDLQNKNLMLNNPVGEMPLNLVFIKVDWLIQDNAVQVRGMQIAGINRK